MRVLVCFVRGKLHREAYRAIMENVPVGYLEMVEVGHDISAYWHEIRKRWTGEDDLMLVEQDNVITPEVIPSFNMCDEPWCTYSYLGPPGFDTDGTGEGRILTRSLGCTRFSADFQNTMTAEMISDKDYFAYYLLDVRMATLFSMHGYDAHVHGSVKHCHKYDMNPTMVAKDRARRLWEATHRVKEYDDSGVAIAFSD